MDVLRVILTDVHCRVLFTQKAEFTYRCVHKIVTDVKLTKNATLILYMD